MDTLMQNVDIKFMRDKCDSFSSNMFKWKIEMLVLAHCHDIKVVL